jgi:hypothetical protein
MRKTFDLSLRDAKRIVDGLELAASWDKTEIYYQLKDWIKEANDNVATGQ